MARLYCAVAATLGVVAPASADGLICIDLRNPKHHRDLQLSELSGRTGGAPIFGAHRFSPTSVIVVSDIEPQCRERATCLIRFLIVDGDRSTERLRMFGSGKMLVGDSGRSGLWPYQLEARGGRTFAFMHSSKTDELVVGSSETKAVGVDWSKLACD